MHWKDWCWSWNSNTLATWCKKLSHWERPWCWERLKAGREGDDRGWDGWMASLSQRTWVWGSSGRRWKTGKPGVLQFIGSQRVGHDWAAEQQEGGSSDEGPLTAQPDKICGCLRTYAVTSCLSTQDQGLGWEQNVCRKNTALKLPLLGLDFPKGPVVKIPSFQWGDVSSIPAWLEEQRSHMPRCAAK